MTRRIRIFASLIAAAALLFSQLAVSAYACPMEAPAQAAAHGDCDEALANPNLCERHCDYGSASLEAAKPVQASPMAVDAGLRITLPDVSGTPIAGPSPHLAAGPAPLALAPLHRFTVLRI